MGLRWRDVDLDNGRLSIEQTLLAPRYQLTVSGPKSEDGWRTVDLDEGTVAVLRAHRKRQAEERLAFGPGYERAALLFPDPVFRNEDGTHLHPALYSLALASAAKAAGLGTVKPEDLRNSQWRCWERRASTRRWCRSGWAIPTLASPCGSTARRSRSSTGRRRIGWASCSPLTAPRPRAARPERRRGGCGPGPSPAAARFGKAGGALASPGGHRLLYPLLTQRAVTPHSGAACGSNRTGRKPHGKPHPDIDRHQLSQPRASRAFRDSLAIPLQSPGLRDPPSEPLRELVLLPRVRLEREQPLLLRDAAPGGLRHPRGGRLPVLSAVQAVGAEPPPADHQPGLAHAAATFGTPC